MNEPIREPDAADGDRSTSEEVASRSRLRGGARGSRLPPHRLVAAVAAVGLLLLPSPCRAQTTLNGHTVVLDGSGKLLSWLPQGQAYGEMVNRIWDSWLTMPTGTGGLPWWYLYPYFTGSAPYWSAATAWPSAPGGQMGMAADAAIHSFPFTGRKEVMDSVKAGLQYMLDHGSTPTASGAWRGVFYNEACPGSTTYNGCSSYGGAGVGDGTGNLEPDKQAELGLAYLWFYMYDPTLTTFRDAAIRVADQLAANRVTNTTRTIGPWPFRVRQTGGAANGGAGEQVCSNVKPFIQLFDLLISHGLGSTATYQTTRDAVWNWATTYVIPNNDWNNYFEDQPWSSTFGENKNQLSPGNFGRFLLENPSLSANYLTWAQGMATWIESNFGEAQVYGATPIDEQYWYMYAMGSHTSRFGALNAWLYAVTANPTYKDKAFRALNWATYMNRDDKYQIDGYPLPNQIWMTDGFGDPVRNFMAAMHAVPEWAPAGEDHLIGSTSVVQSVTYGANRVDYTTFDGAAQEVLRLAFTPTGVLGDGTPLPQRGDLLQQGWTYDATSGVLRVRHDAATLMAVVGTASTALSISPTAASTPPRGSVAFTASGGSGTGFTWTLATNASGGTIDRASGAYTAGSIGSVTDVVQVSDSLANSATASVTVTAGVSISPATASVPAGGSIAFTASGGAGGYGWTLSVNASGGTIDAATGRYQAGSTGGVSDVVQVTDSLGNTATRTVTVTAAGSGLTVMPLEASTPPRGTVAFTASGGSGTGFTWTLATNASHGAIDPASGAYAAGSLGNVIDVVRVSDSLGSSATASVSVTAGVSISPAAGSVAVGGSIAFTASGGSESGYAWTLSANASGGSIDASTGRYQAGSTGDVVDVVQVTDSLGNAATSSVTVRGTTAASVKTGCGCSATQVGVDLAWMGLLAALLKRRRR